MADESGVSHQYDEGLFNPATETMDGAKEVLSLLANTKKARQLAHGAAVVSDFLLTPRPIARRAVGRLAKKGYGTVRDGIREHRSRARSAADRQNGPQQGH
jgi:hypothetical protein